MAEVKISDLTAASAAAGDYQIPASRSGATGSVTVQQIADFALSQMVFPDPPSGISEDDVLGLIEDALEVALGTFSGDTLTIDLASGNYTLSEANWLAYDAFQFTNATVSGRQINLPTVATAAAKIFAAGSGNTKDVRLVRGTSVARVGQNGFGIAWIDGTTNGLRILGGSAGLSDAPYNNSGYVRRNNAWVTGATARTGLGLAIGTDVQAYDADLATLAGLSAPIHEQVLVWGTGAVLTASQSLGVEYIPPFPITVPADMAGTKVFIPSGANPADGTLVCDLRKNGTSVGTISVTTGGTATLATTSGAAQSWNGTTDSMNITGPATPDSAGILSVALRILRT